MTASLSHRCRVCKVGDVTENWFYSPQTKCPLELACNKSLLSPENHSQSKVFNSVSAQ